MFAIVRVPVLGGPGFDATMNATAPPPFPLAPLVIVIHGALLTAVHVHPARTATVALPLAPSTGTFWLSGLTPKVHGAPAWATATVVPATVIDPLRASPSFTAICSATVPFPLPEDPDAMAIHGVLLAAVHAQPVRAVTVALAAPPPEGTLRLGGATPKVQGAAAWAIATGNPATVIEPLRASPSFAAICNATVPLPFPDDPDVMEIQDTPLDAVHAQPGRTVTVALAAPPPKGTFRLVGVTPALHGAWP
jgi:hypothetical protein